MGTVEPKIDYFGSATPGSCMLSTDTVTGSGVAYKTAEAAVFPGFDGISHNDPALLQGP